MNIAIIGARRTRNGIGEYIGKYFQQNGACVACVLGTTHRSAQEASETLHRYGIAARPYGDFSEMIGAEDLDAVVIASPAHSHLRYLTECIEQGISVFCEKPFIDPSLPEVSETIYSLLAAARRKKATLAMNSQWPFCLSSYERLCGRVVHEGFPRRFAIRLSPICERSEMIPDSVPHGLSILYAALGKGTITDLSFGAENEGMAIDFTYVSKHGSCRVSLSMIREINQPRTFSFGFDDRIATRSIDMATYDIRLSSEGKSLSIPDPLNLSVKDFIDAQTSGREPLIGPDHIVSTTVLLKQIHDEYAVKRG